MYFGTEVFESSAVLAELALLASAVAGAEQDDRGYSYSPYEGVDGWIYPADVYQHVNTRQKCRVTRTGIEFEGERNALQSDDFSGLFFALKEGGFNPTDYETSDARFNWYDTEWSYHESPRASTWEKVLYVLKKDITESQAKECFGVDIPKCVPPIGSAAYSRAAAEGSLPPAMVYKALVEVQHDY